MRVRISLSGQTPSYWPRIRNERRIMDVNVGSTPTEGTSVTVMVT